MASQTWKNIAILLHAQKVQTPISGRKIYRFFLKFCPVLGDHVHSCLKRYTEIRFVRKISGSILLIIVTWKFLSPAISHTNFEKKLVSTNMSHMTWNGLKREKTRFYGTLIPSDLVDFRPRIGRYRYDGASLTFFVRGIFHRSPMQFDSSVDLPIGYRQLKTILEYLYCLPRYCKPNMADPKPTPHISIGMGGFVALTETVATRYYSTTHVGVKNAR